MAKVLGIDGKDSLVQIEAERALASEQVLSRNIPWDAIRSATIIQARELELLQQYDKNTLENKLTLFDRLGDEYAVLFLKMLQNLGKPETLQYLLALIEEILIADESKAAYFLRERDANTPTPFEPLFRLLNDEPDWYTLSKACKIVAILLVKSTEVAQNEVQRFFKWINGQLKTKTTHIDLSNALNTLQTLLRREEFRLMFVQEDGIDSLKGILQSHSNNFQLLYQSTYCLWLLSYNGKIAELFSDSTVIHKLVELVRTSAKEKVVRISLATLRNLLDKGTNNKQMIETNLLKEVEKLSQKKWGDEDIVSDLEALQQSLQKNVVELSSFDRYKQELYSKDLQWSPVHRSEKFWRENATKFEENQFFPLTALANILKTETSTPLALAVACHDMGEFVRSHPNGRQLVQNIGAKESIMKLMFHDNADVQREALLSLQKLMVHNWEYLTR